MPSYVERGLNHIWLLHKRAVQLGQAVLLNFKQSYGLKPVCVKCTTEWLGEGLDWSSMKSTSENSTMSRCQSASWSTKHTKAWAKTHCRIQNLPLSSEEIPVPHFWSDTPLIVPFWHTKTENPLKRTLLLYIYYLKMYNSVYFLGNEPINGFNHSPLLKHPSTMD